MKKIRHIAKVLALIMTLVLLAQSGLPSFAAEAKSANTMGVESSFAETDNEIDADDIASTATSTSVNVRGEGETARRAPEPSQAEAKQVDATVTTLTIQSLSGTTVDHVYWSDTFYLAMDWDASSSGADLHKGDYFDITLPEKMYFPSDNAAANFDIHSEDGTTVIGKAHVTPGSDNKGGSVRITFTDWVEGKENVRGSLRLSARFDKTQITTGEENTFEISVSGQVVPVTVLVNGPTALEPEILGKWGQSAGNDKHQAEWYIRINHQKADLSNVVITDHLSGGEGTETYIAESFKLLRVEFDEYGDIKQTYDEGVDLAGKLDIAADGKSFTLKLGDIHKEQYRLHYRTTYTPGTTLRNNMKLSSTDKTKEVSASHISADSGGSGTGNLANKIKLIKVDADDNSVVLAGAVFTVTKPDGSTFELTTGADGTAISGFLTSGTYKVKEKTAPDGYELNSEEFSLAVSSTTGALQTIPDKKKTTDPETISITIEKYWNEGYLLRAASLHPVNNPDEGSSVNRPDSVTIHLLADGTVIRTVELNESNGWALMLSGLPKYGDDGHEIQYTVNEVSVPGYITAITGDPSTGFTITNTAATQVKVTKKWVGPALDSVNVDLLADGRTKETVTLNDRNDWTYTFKNLQKYDSTDGHEIDYTVTEDPLENYFGVISGTARDGYTITNTIVGKISIPVTKVWSGGTGSKAVVHLFADGSEIASQELKSGNQWQHTFENLDKYKDGKEIRYTLTEDGIPGYSSTITYSAEWGFTVTNTKDPSGHHDGGGHGDDPGNGGGTGAVGLYKVDAQTGTYLAGAQFALYRSDGTRVGTYTTDSNGYLKVQNLAYGSYYFVETKAPENYVLDPDYVSFTLDKAHSTGNAYPWNIKVSNTKSGVKTITDVGIKTWENNNNAGGSKPTVITPRLPANGANVSKGVATGDDSHMVLYLFLMIGSLIVLVADLFFLRKHKVTGK